VTEPHPAAGLAPKGAATDLDLRPLTARSVILSVLLGTHPPVLPVRSLVQTAALFGIQEGTTRVALSRLMADGDVVAEGRRYRLTDRLVDRQRRQDEGRTPQTRPWRGSWEIAIIDPEAGPAERTTLGAGLAELRLAELRSGIWLRPANLRRPWAAAAPGQAWCFETRSVNSDAAAALSARLWDLGGWAQRAEALLDAWRGADQPARRFVLAAAMVRHLQRDPLLPRVLLPGGWPGRRLRQAYAAYERELGDLLRHQRGVTAAPDSRLSPMPRPATGRNSSGIPARE
jgi:phenylacetic acid degradation operon negative regulatory protein